MSSDSDRIQSQKKHGGTREDQPAGPFTWNIRLDSSKLTELEMERMREVVRPWLVITKTETGFALTARTLGSLATGTIYDPLSEVMSLW